MAKKLIALLLAVLMLAGMLAGCAKTAETPAPATEDPADTSDSSNTPAPSSDAEPIEISIAYEESTHPVDTDTFAACKKLEETLGIKINWLNWGGEEATYKEKLNLAMASGTAPDLFMIHGADEAKRYVNQDLLLCIEDYWQDYPNIAKYIDTEKVREAITYSDNGKIYTTVRQYSTPVYWFGLLARKDIINDLGFEYDGTIESLTDLMRAMKEKTGSYVFSVRNGVGSLVTNFASIFGASMGGVVGWNANEGKYTFEGNDEHLYNELVWLNQLYTEGLMDPEYALNSTEMWEEKMSTGKATVTFDYLTRSEDFTNAVRGEDPNAAYELGPIAMPVTALTWTSGQTPRATRCPRLTRQRSRTPW